MKRHVGILLIFLAALSIPRALSAHTILIDTWEQHLPEKMDLETRKRVISAETGIMDSLFDGGHIFFNTYSVPGEDLIPPDFANSLNLAGEIGAEFLIRLDPDEEGLRWSVYEMKGGSMVESGYNTIDEVDADLPVIPRWTALGVMVARELQSVIG